MYMKMRRCNKLIFYIMFIFLIFFNNIFAVNNEEAIDVNRRYKTELDLNKYGGEEFAKNHIRNSSEDEQLKLLRDRNEIRKRIDAVSDLLKESKQYNMRYTWGGNHTVPANTREAIKGGMDCSGWCSQYLYMLGVDYHGFATQTANGYHKLLEGVVATAERKGYKIRVKTYADVNWGYVNENGWIYTYAWGSKGIVHIGMSVGNQMSHARGGQKPEMQKTIDLTGRPARVSPSKSFNMEDIIYFLANEPATAKAMGFKLKNMVDPDKVRADWASVTKGNPGGALNDGAQIGEGELGDDDLDLAFALFHIEFNFDEWFANPIFENVGKIIDYLLPIAVAIATLFIIIRILYQILQAVVSGDYSFKKLFFSSLEKMLSACIVLILLGFYKEMVYKPLVDFVAKGFIEVAFGKQIDIMTNTQGLSKGSFNSIYYLALKPLEMFCDYWIATYRDLTTFNDIYDVVVKFGDFLEYLMKSLLMLFCCCISVWLGIKFVVSIFLMMIMISITLAFGVINLALSSIPFMSMSGYSLINAVISSIMKIVPIYLIMFVWIDFVQIIMDMDIGVGVQLLLFMALFMMTGFVFWFIRKLIKYVFIAINYIIELIKSAI